MISNEKNSENINKISLPTRMSIRQENNSFMHCGQKTTCEKRFRSVACTHTKGVGTRCSKISY